MRVREGVVIEDEAKIVMKAQSDSEIILVVSAAYVWSYSRGIKVIDVDAF